jgi:alkanesulfonate monooxygenase SsuD/methylene tetrahydromethanopterin reductase-like flavin-dependent oxidoreductase (luciferase family)
MAFISLRYDLRRSPDGASYAALYDAALDQCAWADTHGFDLVTLSEHHVTDDGFLPSPTLVAAAIAQRTRRLLISVSALLAPLADPLRLAEDLAVLDHLAGGRLSVVLGLGYREIEFDVLDVPFRERTQRLEAAARLLQQAWTGEPFSYRGHTVRVLPTPRTPGGPLLLVGGSAVASARRAARLGLGFAPAIDDPALIDAYTEACADAGHAPGIAQLPVGPTFVHVTDDPERDWPRIVPHALHDAATYRAWQAPGNRSIVESTATDEASLRAEGKYRVVTPAECVELVTGFGDFATFVLHPLMGGLDPDLAWSSLELVAAEVLPQLKRGG